MAKPPELSGLKYSRDFWPLTELPQPRKAGELLALVLEAGVLNCQVLVHLVYDYYWQLLLPHHLRSFELFADTEHSRFLLADTPAEGIIRVHEQLEIGDILFFVDKRKDGEVDVWSPRHYHLAVVWEFSDAGEPLLLHAVSFADRKDAVVLCRLSRFEAFPHRICMGIKRLLPVARDTWRRYSITSGDMLSEFLQS